MFPLALDSGASYTCSTLHPTRIMPSLNKKILLTAFEPFGGETINPSSEVARALGGLTFEGVQITSCELPVDRFRAVDSVLEQMRASAPDVVLMLGEAGGRAQISLERTAVNLDDFRIPDNAGHQPQGEPIVAGGPWEYTATLPLETLVGCLTRQGIPATISTDAGRYLCNRLFYGVMHEIATGGRPIRAGFIHLPYLPEQVIAKKAGTPSLPLETLVTALATLMDSC